MSRLRIVAGLVLASSLWGCGSSGESLPVVKASGTVKYQGVPLDGVTLVFAPADGKHVGSALSDSSGKFVIQTQGQSGAMPGTYKVIATKSVYTEPKLQPGEHVPTPGQSKQLLPEQFSKLESTPLSVTIPDGGSDTLEVVIQ